MIIVPLQENQQNILKEIESNANKILNTINTHISCYSDRINVLLALITTSKNSLKFH